MSYGIVRIQKFTAGSVRGIDIHDNRKKEFSHTNKDVDFSKSENNYTLKQSENSFYNSVQERIKALELPKAVRKDAVVMSQALITSDKLFFDELSKEQQEDFFKKSYNFIENRYGKENIISATVHLDEKTPHMHVNFVPVTLDGRLCAKDRLNKKEMQSLQNDVYRELFKSFGLERGIIREEKQRHLEVSELKAKTAAENVAELTEKRKILTKDINTKLDKRKALQSKIEQLQTAFNTAYDIPEGKPSLLGDKVTFTKEEADKLKETAKRSILKNYALKDMQNERDIALSEANEARNSASGKTNEHLRQQLEKTRNEYRRDVYQLERELKAANKEIDLFDKALDERPDIAKILNPIMKALDQQQKNMDMDRGR